VEHPLPLGANEMTASLLSPSRIVCAAIRRKDTGAVIVGARHFDQLMIDAIEARKESMPDNDRTWRRDQFVKFTNEYDKRRKKNFGDVFSEISLDQLC
jgi:hypothetical protein